eukprot:gb/GEZN01015820.1/.p1 GENE.gb/GEZN01015820.1/~~gb/GEZN01015820.1/.p1  ORF type:complete len:155 (+),score=26.48 gb/GEZN01015820.1/:24-467(+)
MLDKIYAFFANNPVLVCLLLFMAYKYYQSKQPFPESPGNVEAITTIEQWDKIQEEAKKKGQYVVADFYATWCPPCRTAAVPYGQLSIAWPTVKFVKVNVDEAKTVSQKNNISAMPTFKLFHKGQEVSSVQGWSPQKISDMLNKTKTQ